MSARYSVLLAVVAGAAVGVKALDAELTVHGLMMTVLAEKHIHVDSTNRKPRNVRLKRAMQKEDMRAHRCLTKRNRSYPCRPYIGRILYEWTAYAVGTRSEDLNFTVSVR